MFPTILLHGDPCKARTLCLANLAVLRATRRAVRAGWIGAGLLLTLVTLSNWASGGFYDPNFGWLYVIPIIAALVVDARAGWVFTGIVLALSLLFWAASEPECESPVLRKPFDIDALRATVHAQGALARRDQASS